MKKKTPIIIIVLLVVGLIGWKILNRPDFMYAGTLEATEVDISPQVGGVISKIAAKEGETVKQDQVLVEIAGEDIRLAADIAARDFKRAQTLRASGSIPEETFEKLRYKRDDTALRAAWCTIKSPLTGNVLDRYHEPGELVAPGTKILTLADLSEVWAYVYVPERMLGKLSLNQPIKGLIPELKKEFDGRIASIRDEAEFTPKNVQTREERTRLVYGVKVVFANPNRILKPGMTIEAKLPE